MNPEKFTPQEQVGLDALEKTIESILSNTPEGPERDEAHKELMTHLAGMSPDEFDFIIERSLTREELLEKWLKEPALIAKYRDRFNSFSMEDLQQMLRNVKGHQNETIIEDTGRTGTYN